MIRRRLLMSAQQPAGEDDILAGISEVPDAAMVLASPQRAGTGTAVNRADVVQAAEAMVVGAVLADNKILDVLVDELRFEDFSDPALACAYAAALDIIEGKVDGVEVADPVTVMTVPGVSKMVTLSRLQGLAAAASRDSKAVLGHARIVRRAASERGLAQAVSKASEILSEDKSLELRSDEIVRLLSGVAEVRQLPVMRIGDAAAQALKEMAAKASAGSTGVGIPTGFSGLDALIAGLHGGQLVVVAARPGVGKTSLALSMALNATAAGYKVLVASMEMKALELSKRAISILSGVDSHAMRLGALSEEEWEAAITGAERLAQMPLEIVDLPSVNLSALSGLCRRLKRQDRVDMVIVDYLQIMETSGAKGSTREQLISELSRGLKKLAMQLDIPVVALSQLNRAVESRANRRPMLSDLRESGAIEQDADVVIFIHRDTSNKTLGGGTQLADIIVEKQRAGPTGEVQVAFISSTTGFLDLVDSSPHGQRDGAAF